MYDRLCRRYFRKKGVNAVFGEQVQVLSCPGAVAQPAEQREFHLGWLEKINQLKKEVAWGLLEAFSIPSNSEIIELDGSLAKPQL